MLLADWSRCLRLWAFEIQAAKSKIICWAVFTTPGNPGRK